MDPIASAAALPVPADAVRVWRGYRHPAVSTADFFTKLGAIFIPVTVQMQRLFQLTAYLPAVLPANKPQGLPDEIALVFYRSQQAYSNATLCAGGRAYSLLHATVFDLGAMRSSSGFPVPLSDSFALDTAYHLFNDAVDWQQGHTQLFVGARRSATDPALFAHQIGQHCSALQALRPVGIDGVIVVAASDYVICWEHWLSASAAQNSTLADLAQAAAPVWVAPYSPAAVNPSLDSVFSGLAVSGGECFNTQFPRLAGID